jgi:hypothetical protein
MATLAQRLAFKVRPGDRLSGTPRAHAIDRWIYVFTAASFILIVLTGFIPDSVMKINLVRAGARPPFPLAMHVHAVLMGSFLLLLLAQTLLAATGRIERHRSLGRVAMVLVPALVVAGIVLASVTYHGVWNAAHYGPAAVRADMQKQVPIVDDILLMQLRIGILFPLFMVIGLRSRIPDPGMHKRMMILGTASALPAAFDRMTWLPSTFPASAIASDLYVLLAVSPMVAWDLLRNRSVHRAYWIFLAVYLPFMLLVNRLWDTPWWHGAAPKIMGL